VDLRLYRIHQPKFKPWLLQPKSPERFESKEEMYYCIFLPAFTKLRAVSWINLKVISCRDISGSMLSALPA
jgi:hypothetical protein